MSSQLPPFANPRRAKRMRASDADREQCAQLLKDAFADGRLDSTELHERSSALWAVRTHGDLRELVDDLISAPPRRKVEAAPPEPPEPPEQPRRARNVLATILFVFSLLLSLAGIGIAVLIAQRSDETVSSDDVAVPDRVDMLTPDGLRTVVDAFIETSGDSKFVELTLDRHGGYATVPGADLLWSDGRVTEVDLDPPADEAALFDADDDLELDGIGELVESASEVTGITGPVTKSLEIRRTDSADRRIEVLISVINAEGATLIAADYKGDVITTGGVR